MSLGFGDNALFETGEAHRLPRITRRPTDQNKHRSLMNPSHRPKEVNRIAAKMGDAQFEELSKLFGQHPEVSDMNSSPSLLQLEGFLPQLMAMPYVQGLFEYGGLRGALDALERGYQTFRQETERPVVDDACLRTQAQKEREVRFIMRVANLFGSVEKRVEVLNEVKQKKRKRSFEGVWL